MIDVISGNLGCQRLAPGPRVGVIELIAQQPAVAVRPHKGLDLKRTSLIGDSATQSRGSGPEVAGAVRHKNDPFLWRNIGAGQDVGAARGAAGNAEKGAQPNQQSEGG